ncbi:hypothetical protein GCM10010359_51930 [Streptomyces morookaense]|nr:hypothetical protein GCM10010359_51930 [Streptomyces morookaense]
MNASTIGSAAPSRTVSRPSGLSTGAAEEAGEGDGEAGAPTRGRTRVAIGVSLTDMTMPPRPAWYQSVFILVPGLPGTLIDRAAPWRA